MRKFSWIILCTLPIFFSSCFNLLGDGSDTVIKTSVNESHTKKAVLFLREAGATVANSYQVSILNYKDSFDTTAVGNAFTVDDDHGKTWLHPDAINLNWLSDGKLEISYDKKLRTFTMETSVNDVTVFYKAN
jgi:hypothetical protein